MLFPPERVGWVALRSGKYPTDWFSWGLCREGGVKAEAEPLVDGASGLVPENSAPSEEVGVSGGL